MSIFVRKNTPDDLLNAVVTGNALRVQRILAKRDCPSGAPELVRALHSACANGSVELVTLLLDYGVDPNARDTHGLAALDVAIEELNLEIVDLLIRKGADVNAKDGCGLSPLHLAIDSEVQWHVYPGDGVNRSPTGEIVKLLIEAGGDVAAETNNGQTPLQWAKTLGHKPAEEILLRYTVNQALSREDSP
jgi:ankyrin repeat protein